jgi:hypothetical protein
MTQTRVGYGTRQPTKIVMPPSIAHRSTRRYYFFLALYALLVLRWSMVVIHHFFQRLPTVSRCPTEPRSRLDRLRVNVSCPGPLSVHKHWSRWSHLWSIPHFSPLQSSFSSSTPLMCLRLYRIVFHFSVFLEK